MAANASGRVTASAPGSPSSRSPASERALQRARQALRCLPLRLAFYRTLETTALSSYALASVGTAQPGCDAPLCSRPLTAGQAERLFIWLIRVGVLRREVDGQGLTERVRLTPLGRQALSLWSERIPPADPLMRLHHWLRRLRPRL